MKNQLYALVSRRVVKVGLVLMLAAAVAAPIAASASHRFEDVPDSNIFHSSIAWLADNGVTKGCNPPANNLFCPDANVSRGQMAAFMQRLATNKVVDAATALTAGDSDTVDGRHVDDLAPSFMTSVDDDFDLNIAPSPVVCMTDEFTPTTDMTALVLAESSVLAPSTGLISWYSWSVYTTDGGANWNGAAPNWVLTVDSAAGETNGNTANAVVELEAGTAYQFAQRLVHWTGQTTADEFVCKTIVQLVPRTTATGLISQVDPFGPADGRSNAETR